MKKGIVTRPIPFLVGALASSYSACELSFNSSSSTATYTDVSGWNRCSSNPSANGSSIRFWIILRSGLAPKRSKTGRNRRRTAQRRPPLVFDARIGSD
ncbi:MAG TPA: hypothetical protein VLQ48_04520 [Chloroflexia bacterium]|nr:hypothetical protein [Chloroflexia bacterium]